MSQFPHVIFVLMGSYVYAWTFKFNQFLFFVFFFFGGVSVKFNLLLWTISIYFQILELLHFYSFLFTAIAFLFLNIKKVQMDSIFINCVICILYPYDIYFCHGRVLTEIIIWQILFKKYS